MRLVVANGQLLTNVPGSSTFTLVTTPSGVTNSVPRPCFGKYRRTTIINGRFNPGVAWRDDVSGLFSLGISKPAAAPTIAVSGTGLTGEAIGYITFAHKSGATFIHEGNLSAASNTLSLSNQGVQWTLPGSAPDARVTHVRGYRSMDGDVPKLVFEQPIATVTFTENVSEDVRQASTPAPVKLSPTDNETLVDADARGIPPYCLFNIGYHDRMWYAGDPLFPQRVWYTRLFEPESVNLLTGYIDTRDSEAVTGMGVVGDQLVVFGQGVAYDIQGYTETDFNMRKLSPAYGCIAHHAIVNVQETLFFPSEQGVSIYTGGGAIRNIMARSMRDYFTTDYKARPAEYQNATACHNVRRGTYELLISLDEEPKSLYYVAYYRPMIEESALEPYWSFKIRDRKDYAVGTWFGSGELRGEMITGSCDGFARHEDDTDDDDDGDTYDKKMVIRTKHFFFGDQGGGGPIHGRSYTELDLFVKNEVTTVIIKGFGGDDQAYLATAPQFLKTFAPAGVSGLVPSTSQHFPLFKLAGGGVTWQLEASHPLGVEYRGMNIYYRPGAGARPAG
jgi:hypothetical protein